MAVLHHEALPYYSEKSLEISSVLSDNGKEFYGGQAPPFIALSGAIASVKIIDPRMIVKA